MLVRGLAGLRCRCRCPCRSRAVGAAAAAEAAAAELRRADRRRDVRAPGVDRADVAGRVVDDLQRPGAGQRRAVHRRQRLGRPERAGERRRRRRPDRRRPRCRRRPCRRSCRRRPPLWQTSMTERPSGDDQRDASGRRRRCGVILPMRTRHALRAPARAADRRASDVTPLRSPSGMARGTSLLSYEAAGPALPVGSSNATSVGPADVCSAQVQRHRRRRTPPCSRARPSRA